MQALPHKEIRHMKLQDQLLMLVAMGSFVWNHKQSFLNNSTTPTILR